MQWTEDDPFLLFLDIIISVWLVDADTSQQYVD